ncbi:MAG TPA: DUF2585 family protein [Pyrinomonadaceae bacterium]|nr:DUF2585 family protein [Pyrinomonadaceae bacterium]
MTSDTPWHTRHRETLWLVAGLLLLFVVTALLLRLEGRLWICACGTIKFWVGNTCSSDNSQHLLDPFAFTHVLHGVAFYWVIGWVGVRLRSTWQILLAIAIESAWEVFENTSFVIDRYRTATAALGYTGDTVVNSLGDILCCLAGFLIARRLGFWRSLVVFLLVELTLMIWIKDSLLLQILMLISPVSAIKNWQSCP